MAADALKHLSGVETVDKRPCVENSTGSVQTKDGGFPNVKQWEREFKEMAGDLFTLRGVEATIDGEPISVEGKPALRIDGSAVMVVLRPLKQKVQWDLGRGRPQAATASEKEAFQRLSDRLAKHKGRAPKIRIVGPILLENGSAPALTVRKFVWN